jgi:hypothetical protein
MDGDQVQVIYPGDWNLEAGPDFQRAILILEPGHRRLEGDVEIHINQSDWVHHHHEGDPAYANVVLHVFWNAPLEDKRFARHSISLQEHMAGDILPFAGIDTTAYPYNIPSQPHPASACFRSVPVDAMLSILEAAGEERFRRKACLFIGRSSRAGVMQALYEDVLAALGYKQNAQPARELAQRLPYHQLMRRSDGSANAAYALYAGLSGLLPEPGHDLPSESVKFLRETWDAWWRLKTDHDHPLDKGSWNLSRLRPSNHPLRRLMAAAWWFHSESAIFKDIFDKAEKEGPMLFKRLRKDLTQFPADHFWSSHLSLTSSSPGGPVSLVGPDRAGVILSNALLPALIASGTVDSPMEWLAQLPPEPGNAISRQTAQYVFGRDYNDGLLNTPLRRQGMLQLFQDFFLTGTNPATYNSLEQAIRHFLESSQSCHQ